MRPILVNIPSKLLFVMALLGAIGLFVVEVLKRRRDPDRAWSSTPFLLLIVAGGLARFKTGSFLPSLTTFGQPWAPVPIYAYGVMLGTSLAVGWYVAMRLAKADGIDQQEAGNIYMWTAIWAIIGSRLLWYFTTPEASVFDIVKIWEGGLVAYGGMIGGFLASWYCCRKRNIPLLQWADVSAPSVVLGTGITRIGCFLFGCDYGARSGVPWAVRFPGPNALAAHGSPAWQHHVSRYGLPHDAPWSFPVHPTQIYESVVGLALFGLLMLIRRHRKFSGQVFLAWVLGYGIMRPLIETVRDDDDRGVYSLLGLQLSTSQIIGIVSVALGIGLLVILLRRYRRDPESLRLWERTIVPPQAATVPNAVLAAGKRRKRR
jgi:prolipoprotein diacylglyceryl transferase